MELERIMAGIRPADEQAMENARQQWDSIAKPLGSLGQMEEAVVQLAGITGSSRVRLSVRELLVLCADNGIAARGVCQSDASVTASVAAALGEGTSTASYMADEVRCRVIPVDIGMLPHGAMPGVTDCHIRQGTGDISEGPAMTREECIRAIETGAQLAIDRKKAGADILLAGEMGIGNTTTASAVSCVLLGRSAGELAGRGAGLSDEGLREKRQVIARAIAVNRPDPADPVDILCKVGGLDLAGLCGLCLGAAYARVPLVLDGVITLAAALCAVRLIPGCAFALLGSHLPAEPAGQILAGELSLRPPVTAGLRLGEGTGALLLLPLLDTVLRVYHSGHTFGNLGIEQYQKLS